jgi:hypothetical protein
LQETESVQDNSKSSPKTQANDRLTPEHSAGKPKDREKIKPDAPPPPPPITSTPPMPISQNDDLPPPPTLTEIEGIIEPPLPFKDISSNHRKDTLNSVLSEIFDEICIEVIKCDHTAPSIPDVILQVISEYLSDQQKQIKDQQQQAQKDLKDQETRLNRNRARKTITKTFVVDGQTVTQKKTVNIDEEERLKRLQQERKKDLFEHRRNLNEDKRKILELTKKQDIEKDGLDQDFKEQKEKLQREFDLKIQNVQQLRKCEIEKCLEAQLVELKSCLKKIKLDNEKMVKIQREKLKDELKQFKRDLDGL